MKYVDESYIMFYPKRKKLVMDAGLFLLCCSQSILEGSPSLGADGHVRAGCVSGRPGRLRAYKQSQWDTQDFRRPSG